MYPQLLTWVLIVNEVHLILVLDYLEHSSICKYNH